jgi:hypothetical protein
LLIELTSFGDLITEKSGAVQAQPALHLISRDHLIIYQGAQVIEATFW